MISIFSLLLLILIAIVMLIFYAVDQKIKGIVLTIIFIVYSIYTASKGILF